MRGHPRRCTGASSADLCRFLRLRHECRGRFALACGGAGCAAPKSPPRLITCGCRASGLPCRTLPRDHPWVQAARRRRALRQGLAAQLARRVLAVPAALEVRQGERPWTTGRAGRAWRTLRGWSGLAASGKAERRSHRANAQDLPASPASLHHFELHRLTRAQPDWIHRTIIACEGTFVPDSRSQPTVTPRYPVRRADTEGTMHSVIYLVGLIVVVLFILSFFGLR